MLLDYSVFKNIIDISKGKLKSNNISVVNEKISIAHTIKLVKKLTLNQSRDIPVNLAISKAPQLYEIGAFSTNHVYDRVRRYSINQIIKFLQLLEESVDIKLSSNHAFIAFDDAKIFARRAEQVAHVMTTQGKPRFTETSYQRQPKGIRSRENY